MTVAAAVLTSNLDEHQPRKSEEEFNVCEARIIFLLHFMETVLFDQNYSMTINLL